MARATVRLVAARIDAMAVDVVAPVNIQGLYDLVVAALAIRLRMATSAIGGIGEGALPMISAKSQAMVIAAQLSRRNEQPA